jgi:hypothetical protein
MILVLGNFVYTSRLFYMDCPFSVCGKHLKRFLANLCCGLLAGNQECRHEPQWRSRCGTVAPGGGGGPDLGYRDPQRGTRFSTVAYSGDQIWHHCPKQGTRFCAEPTTGNQIWCRGPQREQNTTLKERILKNFLI